MALMASIRAGRPEYVSRQLGGYTDDFDLIEPPYPRAGSSTLLKAGCGVVMSPTWRRAPL